MDVLRALVLGLVQGVTEFLPVSSSGHLVLARDLFGWADEGLLFDAALHLGTFFAVLVFFRTTWVAILRGQEPRLFRLLVIGTIPAALAGWAGESLIAGTFRGVRPVGVFFLVTAAVLFLADRVAAFRQAQGHPPTPDLTPKTSLLVGLAQVFALLPGLSRSGTTIAAGMFLGLSRAKAVEFSFLLAMPITAAASLEGFRVLVVLAPGQLVPLGTGILAAFLSGLAAIGFLLRSIRARTFLPYVVYLVAVGVVLLFR